jgi:cytosine deaminase
MAEVLKNLRLWGQGEPVDIRIEAGQIAAIGKEESGEDFEGRAVFPGLVESHCHLDKTFSAESVENHSGTLLEAVERWMGSVSARSKEDYRARAEAGLRMALSRGTAALRSHVDMVDPSGLRALEVLLEVRQRWQEKIDIQLVALGFPGTPQYDALMVEALERGADGVGGCPALTADPVASIRSALKLAQRFDKPVDLHMDETEDPSVLDLETLAELTIAEGLQGRVTADHCCSLSYQEAAVQQRVIGKVADARINVIALPAVNLVLQGHGHPPARGVAPIRALTEAGAWVAVGSDNVADVFNPFGNYDLLWQCNLALHTGRLLSKTERCKATDLITHNPAHIMGLKEYGLEVGCKADLVVVDAQTQAQALASLPPRLRVYKAGRLVYREEVSRQWI